MATEKRLIYAEDAMKWIIESKVPETGAFTKGINKGLNIALSTLGNNEVLPTVDAVEVVHGRWVDRYGGKYANPLYECSECKKKAPYKFEDDSLHIGLWLQDLTDYCPNCGAKMDGDGNG